MTVPIALLIIHILALVKYVELANKNTSSYSLYQQVIFEYRHLANIHVQDFQEFVIAQAKFENVSCCSFVNDICSLLSSYQETSIALLIAREGTS